MLDAFSVFKGVSWLPRESKGDVNGGACPRSITGKHWTPRLPVVLDAAPTASERSGPTGPEEPPTAARPSDVQLALDLFRSCFFPLSEPKEARVFNKTLREGQHVNYRSLPQPQTPIEAIREETIS